MATVPVHDNDVQPARFNKVQHFDEVSAAQEACSTHPHSIAGLWSQE